MTAGSRAERARLETELGRESVTATQLAAKVARTLQLANSLSDLYNELSESRQAELLHAVFRSVLLDSEGVTGFVLKPPFDELARPREPNKEENAHGKLAAAILNTG